MKVDGYPSYSSFKIKGTRILTSTIAGSPINREQKSVISYSAEAFSVKAGGACKTFEAFAILLLD